MRTITSCFKMAVVAATLMSMLALAQTASAVSATGGNTTNEIDGYRIHTFTSDGTLEVSSGGDIEVLVVAGGGGGGSGRGAGGGGGGVTNTTVAVNSSVTVTVGAGGLKDANGSNSVFDTITSTGGGRGGGETPYAVAGTGSNGGSGGGGSAPGFAGGSGVSGQGWDGGSGGDTANYLSGGGGGAGSAGINGTSSYGGNGGAGIASSISGSSVKYGGGGGGGGNSGTPGTGTDGGGNGTVTAGATGGAGTPNTGGGGGGGAGTVSRGNGGAGGSGIVIVRYLISRGPEIANLAATNVTTASAWMNGSLISTGGASVTVSVYWGDTDGGDPTSGLWMATNTWSEGVWGEGSTPTYQATALTANHFYYYRYAATNSIGLAWAASTEKLLTGFVTVTNTDPSATRDPNSPDTGTLTIQRDPSATNDSLTVTYAWGGTAVLNTDYTPSPAGTSITLPAGVASTNITITPAFYLNAGTKTVWLTLLPGSYGIGTPASNDVTIADYVYTPGLNETTGAGDWDNGAIWSLGRRALQGDVVSVKHAVSLSHATGYLSSLTITNATLTCSNWNTAISATNVIVMNGGILTHVNNSATTTNESGQWVPDARVYVICTNLTIDADGSIDVTAMGYPGGNWSSATGYGPGYGPGGSGASYGGRGYGGPAPYGSAEEPSAPGSGGGIGQLGIDWTNAFGGNGGGVVRIEATGAVTVNGIIKANGGYGGKPYAGGGSGGSIYIGCRAFAGTLNGNNGVISADGQAGGDYGWPGGTGAGGRIALVYDPSSQSNAAMPTVRFSASSHCYDIDGSGVLLGELGTLYFTDAQLIGETITHNGQLVIPGFTRWSPGNLTLNGGWVRFPDAFDLTVGTNLSLIGNRAALDMRYGSLHVGQDFVVENTDLPGWLDFHYPSSAFFFASNSTFLVHRNLTLSNAYMHVYADTLNPNGSELAIGGDCMVTGITAFTASSSLYLHASVTNATTVLYGLKMHVGGDLYVGTKSWIYAYSQITNGGSVFFTMSNLTVAAGGGFNADSKGYAGAAVAWTSGWGPGAGDRVSFSELGVGGGYGGRGYGGVGGGTYGSSNAPVDPGSGGGSGNSPPGGEGGTGGGLVRIEATRTVTLNGTLNADGEDEFGSWSAGGSGGGIYIRCKTFAGSGGTLTAKGGDSWGNDNPDRCAGGGGGRIAVWRRNDVYVGSVNTNVAGGATTGGIHNGDPGTIVWGWISAPGTVFSVY